MNSADDKQSRFEEAGDQRLQGKSHSLAKALENLARDFEIPIAKLREEAREQAVSGAPCGAAAANLLADRNADLAAMLRDASTHVEVLEAMRHSARQTEKASKTLNEQLEKLRDRLVTAKENCSLNQCKKCGHLHMRGHICYQCGHE